MPCGGIARIRGSGLRLFRRLHERQHHGAGTGIHAALDEDLVVPGKAHHRIRRRAADRTQNVREVRHFDRHMLHIDDEKVETGITQSLGAGGGRRHQPGAERRRAGLVGEPGFEGVQRAHGQKSSRK